MNDAARVGMTASFYVMAPTWPSANAWSLFLVLNDYERLNTAIPLRHAACTIRWHKLAMRWEETPLFWIGIR